MGALTEGHVWKGSCWQKPAPWGVMNGEMPPFTLVCKRPKDCCLVKWPGSESLKDHKWQNVKASTFSFCSAPSSMALGHVWGRSGEGRSNKSHRQIFLELFSPWNISVRTLTIVKSSTCVPITLEITETPKGFSGMGSLQPQHPTNYLGVAPAVAVLGVTCCLLPMSLQSSQKTSESSQLPPPLPNLQGKSLHGFLAPPTRYWEVRPTLTV